MVSPKRKLESDRFPDDVLELQAFLSDTSRVAQMMHYTAPGPNGPWQSQPVMDPGSEGWEVVSGSVADNGWRQRVGPWGKASAMVVLAAMAAASCGGGSPSALPQPTVSAPPTLLTTPASAPSTSPTSTSLPTPSTTTALPTSTVEAAPTTTTTAPSTTIAPTTTTTTAPSTTTTTVVDRWRPLFHSGFGPGVEVVRVNDQNGDLRGSDGSAPGLDNWEGDLEGNGHTGEFRTYLEDGGLDPNLISRRADPDDPANTVLEMRLDSPNVTAADKGRVQAVLRHNPDLREFSYEVRLRLQEGFAPLVQRDGRITWLTLAEFWNDLPGTGRGFRVTLNIIKDDPAPGTPLTWHVHGQEKIGGRWNNDPGHGWSHVAANVPVPLGEWVTLRVHLRDGDESTGLVRIEMVDRAGTTWTIADVRDRTRHPAAPADGFNDINPMKLYTSGELLRGLDGVGQDLVVLWDDFTLSVPEP